MWEMRPFRKSVLSSLIRKTWKSSIFWNHKESKWKMTADPPAMFLLGKLSSSQEPCIRTDKKFRGTRYKKSLRKTAEKCQVPYRKRHPWSLLVKMREAK